MTLINLTEWTLNHKYERGEIVLYHAKAYFCLQTHTVHHDPSWNPATTLGNLWRLANSGDFQERNLPQLRSTPEYPEWEYHQSGSVQICSTKLTLIEDVYYDINVELPERSFNDWFVVIDGLKDGMNYKLYKNWFNLTGKVYTDSGGFLVFATTDFLGLYKKRANIDFYIVQKVTITAPPSLPKGMIGEAYPEQQLRVSGGTAPYTYKVWRQDEELPPGLGLDSRTGKLSGTPTKVGSYTFWLGATDANGNGGDDTGTNGWRKYTVTIAPTMTIGPSWIPDGQVGKSYIATFKGEGGTEPYRYRISEGAQPPGLYLDTEVGVLSGVPQSVGEYRFTIEAADRNGYTGRRHSLIRVAARESIEIISPNYLKPGKIDQPYEKMWFQATGGAGPYLFAATGLPNGLKLEYGELFGTPTEAGDFTVKVTATDLKDYSGERPYTLTIAAAPIITISPDHLSPGKIDRVYESVQFEASGGKAPHSFAVTGLPAGLALDSDTLSGTPTVSGDFTVTVTASDADGYSGKRAYKLTIAAAPVIIIKPGSVKVGKVNRPYEEYLEASGGSGLHTFSLASGRLPADVKLRRGGALIGAPAESGSFPFTVTASDADNYTGEQSYTLTIAAAPVITVGPDSIGPGKIDRPYETVTFTAEGGTEPHSFAKTDGTLPDGMALDGDQLAGTPTEAGSFTFTVTAFDADGYGGEQSYTLTIAAAPVITVGPDSIGPGKIDRPYETVTFTAEGGTEPHSFAKTDGTLPDGMALDGDQLAGTPTEAGSFTFTVTAFDADGYGGEQSYTLTIAAAPVITVGPDSIGPGKIDRPYETVTFTAEGGTEPHSFAKTDGTLPDGMALDGDQLAGTPTEAGSFTFTVTAFDADGYGGEQSYTLTIAAAPVITVGPDSIGPGKIDRPYETVTFTAEGGTEPHSFAKTDGTLPDGMALDGDQLAGTPTEAGSFTFTVTASDADGYGGEQSYTLTIAAAPVITVGPDSIGPGKIDRPYETVTFTAEGGTEPHSFAKTDGTLPDGMALDGDQLAGTPTEAGSFTFTVTASDADGYGGEQSYTLTIAAAPVITVGPDSIGPGKIDRPYETVTFTAEGGTEPHSFAKTDGTLPDGMALDGDQLAGTPTEAGSFTFTVTAFDADGYGGEQSYTLTIAAAPVITVGPDSIGPGKIDRPYETVTFTAEGGTEPHSFAKTDGTLPDGMALDGDQLAGTPTEAGSFTFTVTAFDADGYGGEQSYTLTIAAAPVITVGPDSIGPGKIDRPYETVTFTAEGGTEPHSFAKTDGTLPDGMALDGDQLAGTPTEAGSFTFTVTAFDADGYGGEQSYTLTIAAAPVITVGPDSIGPGKIDRPYETVTFTAEGGTEPHSFAKTDGTLPDGMALDGDQLAGTPTEAGSFTFTVTASDADGYGGEQSYTLTIAAAPVITVGPDSIGPGKIDRPYETVTFTAEGGTEPHSFAKTDGTLPDGMALDGDQLAGTPTEAGSFTFTVTASDADGYGGEQSYTLTIAAAPVITVGPDSIGPGKIDRPYETVTFTAEGGTEPHSFAKTDGTLPDGMALDGDQLAGTPTEAGSFTFTVTASDADGYGGEQSYTLTIAAAPVITVGPDSIGPGKIDRPYETVTFTAEGGTEPHSFAKTDGTLPDGMALDGDQLAGTPTEAGSFTFTVTASDADGYGGEQSYTLTIAAAPVITVGPDSIGPGKIDRPYETVTFTAEGGTEPHSFAKTDGTLPDGMALDGDQLAGTPTEAGSFTFTVTASDADGYGGEQSYTLTIAAAPVITVGPDSIGPGKIDRPYETVTFTAEGGTEPHSFAKTDGTLPDGMALDGDQLAGTPTEAGSFTFTVTASDADGYGGEQSYTLTIAAAPVITVGPDSIGPGKIDRPYETVTFTAEGGTEPHSFAKTDGTLPDGMALDGDQLAGTPTEAGSFTFTVTASDADGYGGEQSYTLTIAAAPVITIKPDGLKDGQERVSYAELLKASGGTGKHSFGGGEGLPNGLSLYRSGALAGTPTEAGSFAFTVTASDADGYIGEKPYTLVIVPAAPIVITPETLQDGKEGQLYTVSLKAEGGVGSYRFEITNGTRPDGLELKDNVLSGRPSKAGNFDFTVTATDEHGHSGEKPYTLVIHPAPTIIIEPDILKNGRVGIAYAELLTARGGLEPYGFVVTNGVLPDGLRLDGGALTGTPTAAGKTTFTVTVTDAEGYTASKQYTLSVLASLSTNPRASKS